MKREQEERAKKEALMKEEMKKNKEGNKNEILELFERMKKELEEQRAKADGIEKQAREENEKRIKEAQRIRLEDKQKLQSYVARNVEPDCKSSEGKSRFGGNDQSELSESKQSNGSTRNYSLGDEFANRNMSNNGVGNS